MSLSLLGNGYTVLKVKDGLTGLETWAVTQVSMILIRKYKSQGIRQLETRVEVRDQSESQSEILS